MSEIETGVLSCECGARFKHPPLPVSRDIHCPKCNTLLLSPEAVAAPSASAPVPTPARGIAPVSGTSGVQDEAAPAAEEEAPVPASRLRPRSRSGIGPGLSRKRGKPASGVRKGSKRRRKEEESTTDSEDLPSSTPDSDSRKGRDGAPPAVTWLACGLAVVSLAFAVVLWMKLGTLSEDVTALKLLETDPMSDTGPVVPVKVLKVEVSPDHEATRELLERVQRGVVHCRLMSGDGQVLGWGSGFLIDKDRGYALTNFHVASGAGEIQVMLWDRTWVPAKVLGLDPMLDAAILKLNFSNAKEALDYVQELELGDSDSIVPGDRVWALGSPLGYHRSISTGIVSNTERYLGPSVQEGGHLSGQFTRWIQFDAAVNGGNSGGPVIDRHGKVIGMVTLKSVGAEGMNYALPINMVKSTLDTLQIQGYMAIYGTIGAELEAYDVSTDEGEHSYLAEKGVKVAEVFSNGPAYGILEKNDIITHIDGTEVDTLMKEALGDVYKIISENRNGQTMKFKLLRGEDWIDVEIVPVRSTDYKHPIHLTSWGLYVRALTEEESDGNAEGVIVDVVDDVPGWLKRRSKLEQQAILAQIRPYAFEDGDRLVRLGDQPVTGMTMFYERYQEIVSVGTFVYPASVTVIRDGKGEVLNRRNRGVTIIVKEKEEEEEEEEDEDKDEE